VIFEDGETEEHELLFVPHHGPVRELDVENNVAITLRWAAQDATTDPELGYALSVATNVEEARVAFEKVTAIAISRVVADTAGSIGWYPYNRVPKRTWATNLSGDAPQWLPLDGRCATPEGCYEWTEYFSYAELPQLLNPDEGFIATSNNDMTGALSDGDPTTLPSGEFHPPYQVDVIPGYRRARVVELIEETVSEHDLDTMHGIQNDVYSTIGKDMVPGILGIAEDELTDLSPEAGKVVNALKAWQFNCPTGLEGLYSDSPLTTDTEQLLEASGCAAFHATLLELCDLIAKDEPISARCPNFAAFYSIVDPEQLAAGDIYWDDPATPEPETKHEVMAQALDTVYDLFVNEKGLGTDEKQWAWGRVHGLVLASQLGALGMQYSNPPPGEPPFANAGGAHTVALAYPRRDLTERTGVSMRLVCEMEPSGPTCAVQLGGGQSSHVDSPNYEDLLLRRLQNEPIDLVFDIEEAKANAVRTVTFD
jgi:penicillin amidase